MEKHLNNKDLQKVVTDLCWLHQAEKSTHEQVKTLEAIISGFQYAKEGILTFGTWQEKVHETHTLEQVQTAFGDDWNELSSTKKDMVKAIHASFLDKEVRSSLGIILKQIEILQINFTAFYQSFKAYQGGYTTEVPAISEEERNALKNVPTDAIIYNHTAKCFQKYNGSEWVEQEDLPNFKIVRNPISTSPTE